MPGVSCHIPDEQDTQSEHAPATRAKPFECSKLLAELSDQPELILTILGAFVRETQIDLDRLVAAFDSHDSAQVTRLAHRLKGAAATIGAEPLRERAERIEACGHKGQLQEGLGYMGSLRNEFERFSSCVSELERH